MLTLYMTVATFADNLSTPDFYKRYIAHCNIYGAILWTLHNVFYACSNFPEKLNIIVYNFNNDV